MHHPPSSPSGSCRRLGAAARGWLHCVIMVGLTVMLLWPARWKRSQGGPATIYFFSSESSINNFNMLKGEFDWFFSSSGSHKFQPFRNRADFEGLLSEKRTGLYLMSSWHYSRLADRRGLRPVLVGSRRQSTSQRHVLSARKGIGGLAELRGKTIAAAGSKEFAEELLRQMLPEAERATVSQFKILTVPKDIDALMSVGFGVAAAAITTEGGLERLAKLNRQKHDELVRVATGPEQLLPIIAAPVESDASCEALLSVLTSMGASPDGQQLLSMLGLDAWQRITPGNLEALEK